jgi:hypothetical protein
MTKSQPREVTLSDLRNEIAPLVPKDISPDEVAEGIALSLVPPSERTYPLIKNYLREGTVYAWSSDDASVAKLTLGVLAEGLGALLKGDFGLITLGMSIKELVCFLMDLYRHYVTVRDPLQIKILMLLKDADPGLSATQIQARLGGALAVPLMEVETALQSLEKVESRAGARPLVRSDQLIWKILV